MMKSLDTVHTHTHTGGLVNRKEKGITLIALIITIIVMLILVAVSITLLTNSGIFGQAQTAVLETRAAHVDEMAAIWRAEAMFMDEEDIGDSREARVWELYTAGLIDEDQREALIRGEIIEIGTRTNIHFIAEGFRVGGGSVNLPFTLAVGDFVQFENGLTEVTGHTVPGELSGNRHPFHLADQEFSTENMLWRVMEIQGSTVILVSATPTSQVLGLSGARRI